MPMHFWWLNKSFWKVIWQESCGGEYGYIAMIIIYLFIYLFTWRVGFKRRDLHMLGRHFTNWVTVPAPLFIFKMNPWILTRHISKLDTTFQSPCSLICVHVTKFCQCRQFLDHAPLVSSCHFPPWLAGTGWDYSNCPRPEVRTRLQST
jgi:hypothetical protein